MPSPTSCPHSPPDGVLACGCTTDVLERLHAEAGLNTAPERKLWAMIESHVERHLGPLMGVLHDAEPGPVWSDILVHGPTPERPTFDLVTAGMSAKRMRPPRSVRRRGAAARAELMLRLPVGHESGAGSAGSLMTRKHAWVITWLQLLPRVPHELHGFLGDTDGLALEDRAVPLFRMPGCPFLAAIVADPARFGRPFPTLETTAPVRRVGQDRVRFLSVIPLHQREFEFALDRGHERLFEALKAAGVDDVLRPDRRCVV